MIILIVVLLLTNHAETTGSDSRSEIWERIPNFLTKLCPLSTICQEHLPSNVRTEDSESQYRPCCTDCSCEPDCGDTGNCCFVNNNLSLSNETDVIAVRKETVSRQCLYPVTGEPTKKDFQDFRSYFMISSFPDKDISDQFEACGSKKVGLLGSLYPIYSKQTHAIYKNKLCAEIDNITDGEYWNAILRCKYDNPEDLPAYLAQGSMPKGCRVHFMYPGNLSDIKPHICYSDMVDVCTTTEFDVPIVLDGTNTTKDDITEACQSGLVSPYYGDTISLYANVFCRICSGYYFNENTRCVPFEKGFTGGSGGYIGLLDMDALTTNPDASTTDVLNNHKTLTVCPKNTKNETIDCRPLLCPTGQVRKNKDDCVFLVQQSYQQTVGVLLELNSEQHFEMTKAFNLKQGQNSGTDIKSLSMPNFFNTWTVLSAYYRVTRSNNETSTTCLLVYLSHLFQSADLMHIIQNISLTMSGHWFLKYDNKTLILTPSLFYMRHPYGEPYLSHFEVNESLTILRPSFTIFYTTGQSNTGTIRPPGNFVFLTKLYFCEQIELEKSEYYLSLDRYVLYNKIVQQYLFTSEFVAILDGKVRICLKGSGFVKNNVANCGDIVTVTDAVAVFLVFLALLLLL